MAYHQCKPLYCSGNTCCRTVETKPSVTIGDLKRISDSTKNDISTIWEKNGELNLAEINPYDTENFVVNAGLIHDYCPYLKEGMRNKGKYSFSVYNLFHSWFIHNIFNKGNYGCSIYGVRPMTCAGFPLLLESWELWSDYRCMAGKDLSNRQIEFAQRLEPLLEEETNKTNKILGLSGISLPSRKVVQKAHHTLKVNKKDVLRKSSQVQRAIAASKKLVDIVETGTYIPSNDYRDLVIRIFNPGWHKKIGRALDSLTKKQLREFDQTTEEYLALLKEFSGVSKWW